MNNENVEQTEAVENTQEQSQEVEDSQIQTEAGKNEDKATRAVEKLQKRLGKVTSDKKTLEEQLAETQAELEKFKTGEKTVAELSKAQKAKKEQEAKDKELKSLRAELARTKALSETDKALKEEGLNVPSDVLSMVVSSDNQKTVENVQALVSYVGQIANNVRAQLLTGTTPKRAGKEAKPVTANDFEKLSYSQKVKALSDNPDLMTQLLGGK